MTPPAGTVPEFARGYLLGAGVGEPPVAGWMSMPLCGLRLAYAPEVAVGVARRPGYVVAVIGDFVDTSCWLARGPAIEAAADALSRSEDEFLDVTDGWSGRYLLVFQTPGARSVMTDATGMRSAFYALDGPFVLSSHARLVAAATGAPRSPLVDDYRAAVRRLPSPAVMPMPGRATRWSGVVFLTANQVLDIETRVLRRSFPRRRLASLPTTEVAARIAPLLEGQVAVLAATGRPLALSLTGGTDSRVSLGGSRPFHEAIEYFTYRRPEVAGTIADADAATSMARVLGLRHRVLDIAPTTEPRSLDLAIRQATTLSHGRPLVAAYRRAFRPSTIHVRSNVGEVGRCFYRRTERGADLPRTAAGISARHLTGLWSGRSTSPAIVDAFDEWLLATRFRDVEEVDPLDLFYWEHRMSCWHSNVVLESDFAFDTHVLFNARSILALMLSAPIDDRADGTLFQELVRYLWPELLHWPMSHAAPTRHGPRWLARRLRRKLRL